jgi:hypothetical protein
MSAWDRFLAEWLSLPLVGDINQWGLDHPVEVGTAAVFFSVLLSLLLLGTLARSFSGSAANSLQQASPAAPAFPMEAAATVQPRAASGNFDTFEKHLSLSLEDLSDVGLTPVHRGSTEASPQSDSHNPASRYHAFLDDLSVDELLLVVRYSLLRESGEDAREAVKRISQRGTAEQRRQALALMEGV